MVGAAARLDGHERRQELLEVSDHLGSPELAADNHSLVLINAVELEYRLGGIHTDADGYVHWPLSSSLA
jgi:hypothetical protein